MPKWDVSISLGERIIKFETFVHSHANFLRTAIHRFVEELSKEEAIVFELSKEDTDFVLFANRPRTKDRYSKVSKLLPPFKFILRHMQTTSST